jgi:glutathione S-transferase
MMKQMMRDYGFTDATVRSAPERIIDILEMLTARLTAQRALGSDYFVGKTVTAADIYWACFSIMVEPLPESLCPMTAEARRSSTPVHSGIIAAAAPILIEHRNRMFERFLGPLEF